MERVAQTNNIKEVINNLKDTGKISADFRQRGDEQPGRAIYISKLSKVQVENLHKWEIEKGFIISPSQFRRYFKLKRAKTITNEHYVEIIDELDSRRPKKVEERECVKCFDRWSHCTKKINGKCMALYTDLEYTHAWDWIVFFNSPKELFDSKAKKSKLIDEVNS